MTAQSFADILDGLKAGQVIPYLGPGVLQLAGDDCTVPSSPALLAAQLTAKVKVPHKLRANLTGAAQYIENFKHRSTLTKMLVAAFAPSMAPTELHRFFAAQPSLPLLVNAWYDDVPQKALASRSQWGMVQGVSQTEHFGRWVNYFHADGSPVPDAMPSIVTEDACIFATPPEEVADWTTLLYQPIGSVGPAANFLVSDSDYVEVLTEIDIQTPIPLPVQQLRAGRNFLFLGCRFSEQLERVFARQIMKRSSDKHWAVLPEPPTRNEARFLEEQNITRIDMPLSDFVASLQGLRQSDGAAA
uniref:Uncharacterized protein n=1 Tax=Rhodopseudomonas palustris (strain BisA53) TaxID=316055 RepID=Q07HY0_RHOP5